MTRKAVIFALVLMTASVLVAPAASASYMPFCDSRGTDEPPVVKPLVCAAWQATFRAVCAADAEDEVC